MFYMQGCRGGDVSCGGMEIYESGYSCFTCKDVEMAMLVVEGWRYMRGDTCVLHARV